MEDKEEMRQKGKSQRSESEKYEKFLLDFKIQEGKNEQRNCWEKQTNKNPYKQTKASKEGGDLSPTTA